MQGVASAVRRPNKTAQETSVGYTGFPHRLWASVRLGWQSHADRFQSAPLVAVRSIVPSSLHERKQAASLQSCRSHHTQTDFTTHL